MRHINMEDSEVFQLFSEIAHKNGILDKKASLLYPDFDISEHNPELDIKVAVASEHQMYGVTSESGEDLVGSAHPGGGISVDDSASGDLSKVETIVEQHKRWRDVAESMPTGKVASLAKELVALADALDEGGFIELADLIEKEVIKIALPLANAQEEGALATLPGEWEKELKIEKPELDIGKHKPVNLPEGLPGSGDKFPWNKDKVKELVPEPIENKPLTDKQKMLNIQRLINKKVSGLHHSYQVPENGYLGDSQTYDMATKVFGLRPGVHYRNWDQFASALKGAKLPDWAYIKTYYGDMLNEHGKAPYEVADV